jgi:hypothetical protein
MRLHASLPTGRLGPRKEATMAKARLLVERGTLRDQSEDWGEFDFLQLPSPGDRVTVPHGNAVNYLTVICVHHQPTPLGAGAGPGAHVVAKWTGAG